MAQEWRPGWRGIVLWHPLSVFSTNTNAWLMFLIAYSAPSIVLRLYVLGLSFILRSHPPQPPPLKQCWDLQMSPGGSEMLGDLLKDTQEITESGFELHSFDSTALVFSILPLFQVLERFSLLGCWGWFVVEINLRSCKQKTPRSKLTRRLA